ncbi:SwmB domain-containing protein [Paenibacillus senegalimassiliensis]|uniref:SwmB domain-containing protein n=1 Tax=Paenibacillus senegalimassiliensis TaxID=1737426 RepID=UPI00073EA2F1|nr:SwmB domain-containing protein [Paenibacillus senegalimassiliensis]
MKRKVFTILAMLLIFCMLVQPASLAAASSTVAQGNVIGQYTGEEANQVLFRSLESDSQIAKRQMAAVSVSATQDTYLNYKNLYPSAGSTNVSLNTDLEIAFDANYTITADVDKSGIRLRDSGNDSVDFSVHRSSNTLVISPDTGDSDWHAGDKYTVVIDRGAITLKRSTGTQVFYNNGISWTFTTAGTINDTTAPLLEGVEMYNNRTIRLNYNERLNSDDPRTSYFTVTVNGDSRSISNAYVSGSSVYVVLEVGVAIGQNVRISYSGSDSYRAIQDRSGNLAAAFSAKDVTNGVDSVMPKPRDGHISGSTLTLSFNESLKSVSTYAYQQFTVTADGSVKSIDRLSQSGSTVTLYLSSAVTNGQVVKVSYTPGSYPLKNSRDLDISAFSDFLVRNYNDTKPPELVGVEGSENKITMKYNEALRTSITPPKSYFSVLVNNSPVYVTKVEVESDQVTLTLASSFNKDQNVTLSYVSGVDGIADLNGNLAGYINLKAVGYGAVADGVQSAAVNGDILSIVYNKSLRTVSNLPTGQFSVLVNQVSRGVQAGEVSGDTVLLKLTSPVTAGQTVVLTYYTGTNPLYDGQGNMLKSFSNMPVQNLTGGGSGATQLDYLNTVAAGELGSGGYLLNMKAATTSSSQSRRGQAIKRYVLDNTKLRDALQFLDSSKATSQKLIFEVPATEKAAELVVPIGALIDYYSMGRTGTIALKYKDVMYELPLEKIPYNSISRHFDNTNLISAFVRIQLEPVSRMELSTPYAPTTNITPLVDPVEVQVSAYNGLMASNSLDLDMTGKLYFKTPMLQSGYGTVFLSAYDRATGAITYIPSSKSGSGSGAVLTGVLNGNFIVGPAEGYSYFSDVSKHWAKNDIAELSNRLIISARSSDNSKFQPNENITRAEFAEFIVKGLGLVGDEEGVRRFPDVSAGVMGAYIGAAAKAGIINGNSDGTFKPNSYITREQMALMMVRAMDYAGYDMSMNGASAATLTRFKDVAKIQSKDTVAKAVKEGIIQGVSVNTFQPQGNATRAQAAVMLKRVLDKLNYL